MTTMIPIERLSPATLIEVPGFGAAFAYEANFDGYGYDIQYCTDEARGWNAMDSFYVPVGSCVEFAGRGEPSLREPDEAEREALAEARSESRRPVLTTLDAVARVILDSVREGSEHQMEAAQ